MSDSNQDLAIRQAMRLLHDGTRALREEMRRQRRAPPQPVGPVVNPLVDQPPEPLRTDNGVVVVEVDNVNQTVTVTPSESARSTPSPLPMMARR